MKPKKLVYEQGESISETVVSDVKDAVTSDSIDKDVRHTNEAITEEVREKTEIIKPGSRLRKMYEIVIPKQNNTDMNMIVCVPNHDGGKDWRLERGKPYIVPDYVVNILKESIMATTEYSFLINAGEVKIKKNKERVPRFALDIRREMTV